LVFLIIFVEPSCWTESCVKSPERLTTFSGNAPCLKVISCVSIMESDMFIFCDVAIIKYNLSESPSAQRLPITDRAFNGSRYMPCLKASGWKVTRIMQVRTIGSYSVDWFLKISAVRSSRVSLVPLLVVHGEPRVDTPMRM
jgi:hypothetical protein